MKNLLQINVVFLNFYLAQNVFNIDNKNEYLLSRK